MEKYKKLIKDELKFLTSKEMKECIGRADYGCCHEIPEWYTKRINKLKVLQLNRRKNNNGI